MSCGFMCISFRFNRTFSAHIGKYIQWHDESLVVRTAQGCAAVSQVDLLFDMCGKYKNVSHDVCLQKDTKQKWCANWSWSWKSESVNHSFWIGYAIHSKYYSMLSFFQSNLFSIYVLSTSFPRSLFPFWVNRDDIS